MAYLLMMWGRLGDDTFSPERVFWLVPDPHPNWVETTKTAPKLDFKETGFRQFVSLSSPYIITDAMLMFGLQYAKDTESLIETLNPVRLMVRSKPGSFLSMSHHFLGAPFEVEEDDVLREFLNTARNTLESTGFGMDVLVVSFNPYLEDLVLSNLGRINDLNYRFFSVA
ncbi:MAG: hypothetical protein Q9N26_01985 [Aquificota bacterium]|nr:hypothetical protein [Aquificota bacterium]